MTTPREVEDLEMALLLEGVYRHAGHDFRGYAPVAVRRRLRRLLVREGLATFSSLQEAALRRPSPISTRGSLADA